VSRKSPSAVLPPDEGRDTRPCRAHGKRLIEAAMELAQASPVVDFGDQDAPSGFRWEAAQSGEGEGDIPEVRGGIEGRCGYFDRPVFDLAQEGEGDVIAFGPRRREYAATDASAKSRSGTRQFFTRGFG